MDTCRFEIFHCLAEFKFLQLCPFLQQECGTIKYEISFAWKRHGRQGWLILEHICGILTITNDHSTTSTGNIIIILLAHSPVFFYMLLCTKIEELTLDRSRYHSVCLCLWEKPKRRIHCHLLRFYFFVDLSHMPQQYSLRSKKGEGVSLSFYLIAQNLFSIFWCSQWFECHDDQLW